VRHEHRHDDLRQGGKELKHSSLTKADGSRVHISECPEGHGKVKSPMCCGQDMTCSKT
jgi:hypothetical protein